MRVLVVDDIHINRLVASRILQKGGHIVKAVESGIKAIAELCREDFDIVLMDMQMPDISGIEAAKIIRKSYCAVNRNQIPILAFSSGSAHSISDLKTAGINGYIAKPINPHNLIATIEQYDPIVLSRNADKIHSSL